GRGGARAGAGGGRRGCGAGRAPRRGGSRRLGACGFGAAGARAAGTAGAALAAAAEIGYPVVLKTAAPGVAHKSDAGGVVLGIRDAAELAAAYAGLAARLGPRGLGCETAGPGTPLSLGSPADPGR